ncbi:hypothetical protein Sfr7A_09180 [Streptomyces xinghaiensis]|uniref:Uncharacterized protein n=1 Tax=Streptomyces xinghaiensis TaxID=1038928 RepID=A0A3R7HVJ5_9ACTN|nr:hypothetical protein Sfr7A_09180 [Streptomyces xinghaiensis]RKM91768.1 hypothetical protein SFRA_027700 [Streptomyces xinghaiensis]RNC73472.1 hypothetical protein DC095_015300 [Streptomyces xinghaiensis]
MGPDGRPGPPAPHAPSGFPVPPRRPAARTPGRPGRLRYPDPDIRERFRAGGGRLDSRRTAFR